MFTLSVYGSIMLKYTLANIAVLNAIMVVHAMLLISFHTGLSLVVFVGSKMFMRGILLSAFSVVSSPASHINIICVRWYGLSIAKVIRTMYASCLFVSIEVFYYGVL